jgi:transposase
VSTFGPLIETGRRHRRRHSAHSKAEAIGACQQPGVSIAAVALARGLNASMLHKSVRQAERSREPIAIRPTAPSVAIESEASFVPVALPPNAANGVIRIEVRRGGRSISSRNQACRCLNLCAARLRRLSRPTEIGGACRKRRPRGARPGSDHTHELRPLAAHRQVICGRSRDKMHENSDLRHGPG